jgi:transcriptional regulator with XRE-family HTH domain
MASLDIAPSPSTGFGATLREWRIARRMSQLDLSLEAGVSARHVSFLETDRARPSREMVETLGHALTLPRAICNELLLAAGYAPIFPKSGLDSETLAPLRAIMAQMMEGHSPYPAMLCDRSWTLLDANAAARALLGPMHGPTGEMNVIRMMTAPEASDFLINQIEVGHEMLERLRLERLASGPDAVIDPIIRHLEAFLSSAPALPGPRAPLCPIYLKVPGGTRLSFLSAIVHFGTSEDISVKDLRLELLFPADEATAGWFKAAPL